VKQLPLGIPASIENYRRDVPPRTRCRCAPALGPRSTGLRARTRGMACCLPFQAPARPACARSVPAHQGPAGALTSDAWWPRAKDATPTWPSEPNRFGGLSSAAGSSMDSSSRRASSSQKLPAHPRSGPRQQEPSTGAACSLRPRHPRSSGRFGARVRRDAFAFQTALGFDARSGLQTHAPLRARQCDCTRLRLCMRPTCPRARPYPPP
jgi:hypothetical protein